MSKHVPGLCRDILKLLRRDHVAGRLDVLTPREIRHLAHLARTHEALLKALIALVSAYEDPTMDDPHTIVEAARAAIAKAEGES